ncbi:MAG: hypothetical protein ACFB2X_25445 [Rivularia sp. (in: cyanobacteria)]
MKGKFTTLIGTALTLALSSTVAVAQSTKFPDRNFQNLEENIETAESNESLVAAADEELSPEAMKILCMRFPLNSRCEGTNELTNSPEETTTDEEITPSEENFSPDNNIDTTPGAPLPESSEEMQPAPDTLLPESSPEGITPMPGTEELPSTDDAPTNINPEPSLTPSEETTPSKMNQPGETTLPDSNSSGNTEEETTEESGSGAKILAP